MAPFVIPASLPSRKAELEEMCQKAGLPSVGTIAELRKRLISKRDGDDADSDDDGTKSGEEAPNEEALQQMTKAELVRLAKRLGTESTGGKDDLVKAILLYQKKDEAKATKGDEWRRVILQRYAKLDIEKLALDWALPAVLLTPAVWPVLLWREPLGRSRLFGPLGTDGDFVDAMKRRWRQLLSCEEEDIERLRSLFVVMWSVVSSAQAASPSEWAQDNWSMVVSPAVKLVRLLQSQKLLKKGQAKTARKLKALAEAPLEELGYDVVELVEKSTVGNGRGEDAEDSGQEWKGGRRKQRYRPGHCRRCGVKATPKQGEKIVDWFREHNKTCK